MKQLESEQLAAWRATLGKGEQLGEDQQAIEVARGMRLIASLPSAAPAKSAKPPPQRTPAPASDPLGASTHSLPGIGPAFAERLAEKGLETVEDLLWCLPRR